MEADVQKVGALSEGDFAAVGQTGRVRRRLGGHANRRRQILPESLRLPDQKTASNSERGT